MNKLQRYKVLSGAKAYNDWLEKHGIRIGQIYVCVGFSDNAGVLEDIIHLINDEGRIINLVYSDDRFELVEKETNEQSTKH